VERVEGEAHKAFGQIDVNRAVFHPMKVTFYGGEERTLMKLLVRADTQQVVGVHIVGPDAPEMIRMAAIAAKMGVTRQQWDSTCAVHSTAVEELVTMREKYVPAELGAVG